MQNNRSIFAHAIPRGRWILALASFLKPYMADSKDAVQPLNRRRVAHGHFRNQCVVGCSMAAGFRDGVSADVDTPFTVKDTSSPSKFVFSHGSDTVASLKAKSSPAWWHDYAIKGEVTFVRGRLKFGGQKNSDPFPSAVIILKQPNADLRQK
jgi:hypothetical protein